MLEVISELEKAKKKGQGVKQGSKKSGPEPFFPRKIVVGNKRDLKKNRDAGIIKEEDISQLDGIKIKEVSALTNQGISDVFKTLIQDLNSDVALGDENKIEYERIQQKIIEALGNQDSDEEDEVAGKKKDKTPGGHGALKAGISKHNSQASGGLWACCGPRTGIDQGDSDDGDSKKSSDVSDDEMMDMT